MKKWYKTTEIAEILSVNYRTVCKWIDSGELHGFRMPSVCDRGHRRVLREKLIEFFNKNQIPLRILDSYEEKENSGKH